MPHWISSHQLYTKLQINLTRDELLERSEAFGTYQPWHALLAKMKDGDQVWTWKWDTSEGYAVVRGNKVVAFIRTRAPVG